jgi:threonine-phosphate decarboxylase
VHPDAVDDAERVPHGGESDRDVLEFSANVNPETPDGVADAFRDALADATRYPDDAYPAFRAAAADALARDAPEQSARDTTERFSGDGEGVSARDVVPTPGGLAAIRLTFATTLEPGDRVLLPKPSFGEYAREAALQGAHTDFVPAHELTDAGRDDAGDSVADGDLDAYRMVVACNPNNPTGVAYDADALRALADRCRDADATLLVDEAFLGFTDEPTLAGEPGVVVARSLTKLYGLPGLRAGYAVATGQEGERLRTARRAWNLSTPAAAVGAHCLRDHEFVDATRERVAAERARFCDRIRTDLPAGVSVAETGSDRDGAIPTERGADRDGVAPFVLLDVGDRDPARVVDACGERGIAIRDATTFRGLDAHVRVAVRTRDENDRLLAVLAEVCDR